MSLTHMLILGLVVVVIFRRNALGAAGKSIGEGMREFKKGLKGESDIDVTDSVKRLDEE